MANRNIGKTRLVIATMEEQQLESEDGPSYGGESSEVFVISLHIKVVGN